MEVSETERREAYNYLFMNLTDSYKTSFTKHFGEYEQEEIKKVYQRVRTIKIARNGVFVVERAPGIRNRAEERI